MERHSLTNRCAEAPVLLQAFLQKGLRFELFIPIRDCLEELIPIVASVFLDSR